MTKQIPNPRKTIVYDVCLVIAGMGYTITHPKSLDPYKNNRDKWGSGKQGGINITVTKEFRR